MRKIFTLGFVLSIFVLGACSSDYLTTQPSDAVGSSTAVATTENAYKALNGIAVSMTSQHSSYSQGCAGENKIYAHYENYPSENYLYNRYAAGWTGVHNMDRFMNNQTAYNHYAWYYYYQLIGAANTILANIDNAVGPEGEKAFIKASALTFRAYSYEKLTRYFCYRWTDSNNGATEGLPLRLDESTGDLPKSTLAETFVQIYKDCQDAINLFDTSDFDRPATDIWIPNKNTAHAVYARAALSKHDYATARAQAKLAKDGFPLMSNAEYTAGFATPTSEWIFGSFGSSTENRWYWSYGTQFSANGNSASKKDTGAGQIGRLLINRIPNNDIRKALFITEDKFPTLDWSDPKVLEPTYAMIGINSNKVKTSPEAWKAVDKYINSMTPAGFTAPYSSGFRYLGGHLKFWVTDLPGVSYLPFIRTSEMVLIEAEAAFQSGDEAGAIAALIELNKTSGRNASYKCTKSGDDLWNEIMDYRELELWGEGTAWSDYKRWGRAVDRKSIAQGGNAHVAVAVRIEPDEKNKWTWVTPQLETDFNGAIDK